MLEEWNIVNTRQRKFVLMPVSWETHAAPAMGDRPQAIINRQVLKHADLLIAVFWTRLGSPTGRADSGTVEEIEEHLAAGKPAMIYFSEQPVHPGSVDAEQYEALLKFRRSCEERGLVARYTTPDEFRRMLWRQLSQVVSEGFGSEIVDTGRTSSRRDTKCRPMPRNC